MGKLIFFNRVKQFAIKKRLCPVNVFVFHSVSNEYNPLLWWECDWTSIDWFKQNIIRLKKDFTFVSLSEAYDRIKNDRFRFHRFSVLTADDGYRSVLNVLPWLEEQKVPITLFVNTKYLDKKSWSVINEKQSKSVNHKVDMLNDVCPDLYMSKEELFGLDSPWITIGMHGHEHLDATKQSEEEFRENVERCRELLSTHPRYVPFFAYTWGRHNSLTDEVLREMDLVPVLANGMKNYDGTRSISRICIDGKAL
jgi:peptidoglycan/xylan/chitin deacetylase (PgdA/CDA1 family)